MNKKHMLGGLVILANSIAISSLSWAAPPLNTVNDGCIMKGGTYYNTPDDFTSFINNQSGGLWLKAGTIVRELEANGAVNGGTVVLTRRRSYCLECGKIERRNLVRGLFWIA